VDRRNIGKMEVSEGGIGELNVEARGHRLAKARAQRGADDLVELEDKIGVGGECTNPDHIRATSRGSFSACHNIGSDAVPLHRGCRLTRQSGSSSRQRPNITESAMNMGPGKAGRAEPAIQRYLRQRQGVVVRHLLGARDSPLGQIVMWRDARRLLEGAAELKRDTDRRDARAAQETALPPSRLKSSVTADGDVVVEW
jgi:hypothetical protein